MEFYDHFEFFYSSDPKCNRCHYFYPCESRDPWTLALPLVISALLFVIPAEARIQEIQQLARHAELVSASPCNYKQILKQVQDDFMLRDYWIPAFAGMTGKAGMTRKG